jgi:hypothetical protein
MAIDRRTALFLAGLVIFPVPARAITLDFTGTGLASCAFTNGSAGTLNQRADLMGWTTKDPATVTVTNSGPNEQPRDSHRQLVDEHRAVPDRGEQRSGFPRGLGLDDLPGRFLQGAGDRHMRHAVIVAWLGLAAVPQPAAAHSLFPGSQTVQTLGERAWVQLEAANGRKDVSVFVVEIFERDRWWQATSAAASPSRLVVPAEQADSTQSNNRKFSVLVDLEGKSERRLRVCTKSVLSWSALQPRATDVASRVCASVTVRKFRP